MTPPHSVYKKDHPVIPKQVVTVDDLRYLGMEKDYPEQLSALPCKKKRNQFLSDDEKDYNKIHSKKRIIIEHTHHLSIEKVPDTCRSI